jgi:hypothetical protein
MTHTAKLLSEFDNMTAQPLIEVKGENNEYYVFDVSVNRNYLKARCTTHSIKVINVRWDTCFSLDGHLETLLEEIHDIIGYSIEE